MNGGLMVGREVDRSPVQVVEPEVVEMLERGFPLDPRVAATRDGVRRL
jgi:hypothetical protein